MATKNTIRRHYLIIRRILQNDYPSKHTLMEYMKRYDVEIGERTFQRDLAEIRSNFDIDIVYDEQRNGYYALKDSTLYIDQLLYFIRLAESSDIALTTLKDRHRLSSYVSISPNPKSKGVEYIGWLLRAIQYQQVISIIHCSYQTGEQTTYIVEPYLLKEFEGIWYLFAYCEGMGVFRTFGLDRIRQIQTTDRIFQRREELERTAEKFDNVYGLVYEPDNNPNASIEEVRLKVSPVMMPYIQSLPIHSSQSISGDTITLYLIINPELENKIMSYGEHIEVLSPPSLRNKIKERIIQSLKKYDE